jgi:hypothetical protein
MMRRIMGRGDSEAKSGEQVYRGGKMGFSCRNGKGHEAGILFGRVKEYGSGI